MSMPNRMTNGPGNVPDILKVMDDLDWLEAVAHGNLLSNPGLETWGGGTTFTNPANAATLADSWTLEKGGTSGATADVTREGTTIDTGQYSMKFNITGAGSANSYLNLKQAYAKYIQLGGVKLAASVRVKCSVANKIRLSLTDGASTVYSSYHTGDGTWQTLAVQMVAQSVPSAVTMKVEITSDFTSAVYIDSTFLTFINSLASSAAIAAITYQDLLRDALR